MENRLPKSISINIDGKNVEVFANGQIAKPLNIEDGVMTYQLYKTAAQKELSDAMHVFCKALNLPKGVYIFEFNYE